ncbi:endonuclease domain-containing protein [Agrobacterium vitis]
MIQARPERLADFGERVLVPSVPFSISWEMVPELVRLSLLPVCGVQPVTNAMCKAANGELAHLPTIGEIAHFRERCTQFQMIQVVVSLAWCNSAEKDFEAVPFAISILPASKRGEVHLTGIDGVVALGGGPVKTESAYHGFDPFYGEWKLYTYGEPVAQVSGSRRPIDELGIVIERYFLATSFDSDDVLEYDNFIPEPSKPAYRRNRIKRLFEPFKNVTTRRLWGLETPIELFLFQELLSRGIRPQCQYLIYSDGSAYQSLYDMYSDVEFRRTQAIVAEADMYLPEKRLAIFCDGSHHERLKQRDRDAKIDIKLKELGIQSVRVPGRLINSDLKAAGDMVEANLQPIT